MVKKRVAVIFGGKTVEHDVSVVTAQQLMENMDRDKYEIVPVYIDHDGQWYTGEKLSDISFMRAFDKADKSVLRAYLSPVPGTGLMVEQGGVFGKKQNSMYLDVVIPAMHGLNGEDGTLQGLLELADIPYVSSGVLGSAAGMDKALMKSAFKGAGIPVLEGVFFLRDEWSQDPQTVVDRVERVLEYPMFVKPANLGSSIGISKAVDRDGLYAAVEVAIAYDRRIIVEHGVEDIVEYNCSVRGYSDCAEPSIIEQPITWKEFLTFNEKYLRKSGGEGMEAMGRLAPAPISEELTGAIKELSVKIFKLFDCKGVVRIDFIYDKAKDLLYANEINTIPGSFAFYLWEPLGIPYKKQIDKLIEWAQQAHLDKNKSNYAFASEILKKVRLGAKGAKGGRVK